MKNSRISFLDCYYLKKLLQRDADQGATQRRVYSHEEYIALVSRSGQFMTHDYSHKSTDEDQRMMAFFDSLVQREIENWSSEDLRTPQSPSDVENNNPSDHDDSSDSDGTLLIKFTFEFKKKKN